MKPIELTEEHKSKLLEMCKVLFPEYKWIQTKPHQESIIQFCKNAENRIEIHWFEFCMINLYRKIIVLSNFTFQTEDFYQAVLVDYHNPIDYLYEEFKKLK